MLSVEAHPFLMVFSVVIAVVLVCLLWALIQPVGFAPQWELDDEGNAVDPVVRGFPILNDGGSSIEFADCVLPGTSYSYRYELGDTLPDGRIPFKYLGTAEDIERAKKAGTPSIDGWAYESRTEPKWTPLDVEDYRVKALHFLWNGKVSKEGIAQLLRDKVDIGKFTADRAARALAAIEAGKPMLYRVQALLKERDEPDVNVTLSRLYSFDDEMVYRLTVLRGGKRGSCLVADSMGLNEFTSAVIGATERLRPPLKGSFLGAAGGPTDVFEQGPLTNGEDAAA